MTDQEAEDVALRLLHTADWHLGRQFPGFADADRDKLLRARYDVLDRILLAAEHHRVDAILCAGDLFEEPNLDAEWWEPLAKKLRAMAEPRPTFLLPGNHDPLQPGSVYHPEHAFRRALPPWVHVVDRDDFTYALNDAAVLHATPCRSRAGQDDPALALPARGPGDDRIRIGLVHGSTFDAPGYQLNFPIAKDAAARRGFDYLAIGDTHSFREVPPGGRPPVVYSGAPEATTFDEPGAGNVVIVFVSRDRRVRFRAEPVGAWTWADRTARSLGELRAICLEPHLARTVLRLRVDLRGTADELEEAEARLRELQGTRQAPGRAGILRFEERRLDLDTQGLELLLGDLPPVLRDTVERLKALEGTAQQPLASLALRHLYRLVRDGAVP